jgi:hypothetical protein
MILIIGLGTFLRALLFGAAAIALENLALRLTGRASDDNSPQPRVIEPPPCGRIVTIPQVGGLHHRSQRAPDRGRAARQRSLIRVIQATITLRSLAGGLAP